MDSIRNFNGDWITDPSSLELLVRTYFHNLFQQEIVLIPSCRGINGSPSLQEGHLQLLNKPFSSADVKQALFDMAPFKAPAGLDGLHAGFYQNLWDLVGDSLCKFVLDLI